MLLDVAGDGAGKPPLKPQSFTQDQVNALVAKEKREGQSRSQKIMDELQALKGKANLTAQERQEFETRIEELNNSLLTKEELAKQQLTKVQKQADAERTALSNERDNWRNRYTESTILRAITDAAVVQKAIMPSQIVAILRPTTRLVEEVNEDGKPTGKFSAKVKLDDVNEKGEPVTLDLSVDEAVKRMREMEVHQNLFQGDGAGGLGSQSRSVQGKTLTAEQAAKQGPEVYRKFREEQEKARGKRS